MTHVRRTSSCGAKIVCLEHISVGQPRIAQTVITDRWKWYIKSPKKKSLLLRVLKFPTLITIVSETPYCMFILAIIVGPFPSFISTSGPTTCLSYPDFSPSSMTCFVRPRIQNPLVSKNLNHPIPVTTTRYFNAPPNHFPPSHPQDRKRKNVPIPIVWLLT